MRRVRQWSWDFLNWTWFNILNIQRNRTWVMFFKKNIQTLTSHRTISMVSPPPPVVCFHNRITFTLIVQLVLNGFKSTIEVTDDIFCESIVCSYWQCCNMMCSTNGENRSFFIVICFRLNESMIKKKSNIALNKH